MMDGGFADVPVECQESGLSNGLRASMSTFPSMSGWLWLLCCAFMPAAIYGATNASSTAADCAALALLASHVGMTASLGWNISQPPTVDPLWCCGTKSYAGITCTNQRVVQHARCVFSLRTRVCFHCTAFRVFTELPVLCMCVCGLLDVHRPTWTCRIATLSALFQPRAPYLCI